MKFRIVYFFMAYAKNIYLVNYTELLKNKLLNDFGRELNHPYFINPKFGFSQEQIKDADGNVTKLMFTELYLIAGEAVRIDSNSSLYDLYYFERIRLAVKSNLVKDRLIELYTWGG